MTKPFLIAPLLFLFAGCSEEGTAAVETDYAPLLRDVGEQVALPAHRTAAETADALVVALRTLETAPDATSLQNAQNAWRTARAAYRHLDAYTFGPMPALAIDARVDVSPADPAGIEEAISGTDTLDATFVGRLGGKKKGYLGVEYLLFKGPAGTDVLSGFAAGGRRGVLARALAEELASSTHQLLDAWDPAKDGVVKQLLTAGSGGKYSSQRAAIDDLVGGGAYALELVVGIRLAMPLGRKTTGNPEPERDPTLASDNAIADMVASMEGVATMYRTPGFSTLVRAKVPALDDKALAELEGCMAKISAIPRPFGTSITQNNALVQEAFEACKALKLTWNTDVTSTLGATVKPLDTDGD